MCADAAQVINRVSSCDQAAAKLARLYRRPVRVVELRFFDGLTEHNLAEVGAPERMARYDGNMGYAWRRGELEGHRKV